MTTLAAGQYFTGQPCKRGHIAPRSSVNRSCTECVREKRAYDIAHRPEYAARKRELRRTRWREREHERNRQSWRDRAKWPEMVLPRIRYRAAKAGLEFSITPADIQLPETCPVLGIPLILGGGINCPNSPSVDRFDNNKGYTPGNVRVISTRANNLKKDASLNEMRLLLAYMEGGAS